MNAMQLFKLMGVVHLHKGAEPPSGHKYEGSGLSTNAGTSWIALTKEWYLRRLFRVPEESLPDAPLDSWLPPRKAKWDGPLGYIFDSCRNWREVTHQAMYDGSPSIALSITLTDASSTPAFCLGRTRA